MSLSYRKARTAPPSWGRQADDRTTGSTRGTAYRVAGAGSAFQRRAFQPGTAGIGRTAQPATPGTGRTPQHRTAGTGQAAYPKSVGTSALQPEAVSVGDKDDADVPAATHRMRNDNVVELFPGAATSESAADRGNWWGRLRYAEAGMATAEYAIATLAAVGFAGLLVVILRSDEVRGFLMTIIQQALTLG